MNGIFYFCVLMEGLISWEFSKNVEARVVAWLTCFRGLPLLLFNDSNGGSLCTGVGGV